MKKILILEDSLERVEQFRKNFINCELIITDDVKIAINKLATEKIDILCLDHDLGGNVYCPSDENSGYWVAKWLQEHQERKPEIIVLHSLNPVGVANMKSCLPDATTIPSVWTNVIDFLNK
jgi:CheY-like chemotaxis protein